MVYNLTNITNAQTLGDGAMFANEVTGGMFWTWAMIAFFLVFVMVLKRFSFESAFLAASWIMFVLSLFLAYGEFVSLIVPLAFLAMAGFMAWYEWSQNRG